MNISTVTNMKSETYKKKVLIHCIMSIRNEADKAFLNICGNASGEVACSAKMKNIHQKTRKTLATKISWKANLYILIAKIIFNMIQNFLLK